MRQRKGSYTLGKQTCILTLDKMGYGENIFLIFSMKTYVVCVYLLEASHRGASNEYLQHMFLWRERTESKCRKDEDYDLWYGPGPLAEFR